jgi:hypothetical protein
MKIADLHAYTEPIARYHEIRPFAAAYDLILQPYAIELSFEKMLFVPLLRPLRHPKASQIELTET